MRYACLEYRILSRIPKPIEPQWDWNFIINGLMDYN